MDLTNDDDKVSEVMQNQMLLWTEGSSEQSQEESRQGTTLSYSELDNEMLADVTLLLNRVAAKSDRLIENTTTNAAEAWMHIRSKFDGGKVINLCNRGSWHARCYGAAVRQNVGPQWAPKVWRDSTGTPAGCHFTKLYTRRARELEATRKCNVKPEQKSRRWKRKMSSTSDSRAKKARLEYGPEALDVTEDLDKDALETAKQEFLKHHIYLTNDKISVIEHQTRDQSTSQVWKTERKKRLTASNFGKIVKRNTKLLVKPLVKDLIYSKFTGNIHTIKGLHEERVTIQEYILKKGEEGINVTVQKCGFIIDPVNKYLGASPDGIVKVNSGDTGLLEIKNTLHNKKINLTQATQQVKNFCLEYKGNILKLKTNHTFFYQCQGQMNIADIPWLDFVIRTTNPYQIHIERIYRDNKFWIESMLPKLKAFYFNALLPEIAAPRHEKVPGIREPGIWFASTTSKKSSAKS